MKWKLIKFFKDHEITLRIILVLLVMIWMIVFFLRNVYVLSGSQHECIEGEFWIKEHRMLVKQYTGNGQPVSCIEKK